MKITTLVNDKVRVTFENNEYNELCGKTTLLKFDHTTNGQKMWFIVFCQLLAKEPDLIPDKHEIQIEFVQHQYGFGDTLNEAYKSLLAIQEYQINDFKRCRDIVDTEYMKYLTDEKTNQTPKEQNYLHTHKKKYSKIVKFNDDKNKPL